MQRKVDTRRREKRERMRLAGRGLVGAVHDTVVEQREIRRVEHVAHRNEALPVEIALQMDALGEREVNRDRIRRYADFDRNVMILREQPQLLAIVVAEQVGARDRRLEHARPRDEAIRAARVDMRVDFRADPDERVAGAYARSKYLVAPVARERVA